MKKTHFDIEILVRFAAGIAAGIAAALVALAIFILCAIFASCHQVMEYPGTTVIMNKDRSIGNIDFEIRDRDPAGGTAGTAAGNRHLPLYLRFAGRKLKLDAATTVDEVIAFVRESQCRCVVTRHFRSGEHPRDTYWFDFEVLWLHSGNGKTLSSIRILNKAAATEVVRIETADGRPFVFPLDRSKVEELLGKNYRSRTIIDFI